MQQEQDINPNECHKGKREQITRGRILGKECPSECENGNLRDRGEGDLKKSQGSIQFLTSMLNGPNV